MDIINQFRTLHLEFIRQHPHYIDRDTGKSGNQYLEILNQVYDDQIDYYEKHNRICPSVYQFCKDDVKRFYKVDTINVELSELIKASTKQVIDTRQLWAFITVGFNEQTITPEKMAEVSKRIAHLKYFKSCQYVLEKHRENGTHHHTHFLVTFNEPQYKSKLLGWIYQIKGMKDICLSKNFIDILGPCNPKKQFADYSVYEEYTFGNKKADKLKYVKLDKEWRKNNKIQDLFCVQL